MICVLRIPNILYDYEQHGYEFVWISTHVRFANRGELPKTLGYMLILKADETFGNLLIQPLTNLA